ncbi:MAG: DUF4920 domain-containing protein [Bacteroidetes bacterium]|nr:MAG: DUF4920 domain-containing protein [Bacteroidota bacterium]
MKYLNWIFVFGLISLALACGPQSKTDTDTTAESSQAEAAAEDLAGKTFGADFKPEAVITYAELKDKLSDTDSLAVTVRGTVNQVCQAKGCWMTITEEGESEGMMVRFKDYGFFMPKDISGREVVMHGKAFYRVTPVEELRHYAEDAGKSQEEIAAITEPKRELSFLADGVILLDQP